MLEHPGLVGLHDGGTEAGRPFVVTDLVEGPTLAERIAEGPLDVDEVRASVRSWPTRWPHVHEGGIVHRDIKPANVLLERRPRRASPTSASPARWRAPRRPPQAAWWAPPPTWRPEQVRGEEVGPPADVYALGLVLLESLTGRREYPGAAVESATARLYRRPAVPDELPASWAGC